MKINRSFSIFLCIIFLGLFSTQAIAASFDCKKASTWVEKIVCSNPELSKLDEQMAKAYSDALKSLSPEGQKETKQYQKQWLKELSQNCEAGPKKKYYKEASPYAGGKDKKIYYDARAECLKTAYEKRIKQLQDSLVKFSERIFRNVHVYISKGDLTYPQIENPRDENEKYWNYVILKRVNDHPVPNAECTVSFSKKHLISIIGYHCFSWLLEDKRELKPSNIFDDKTDWRNKLMMFVAQKKKEKEVEDISRYLDPDIFPSQWKISEGGLSFDLDTYNFRSRTASITVDWKTLDPYLSNKGRSLIYD